MTLHVTISRDDGGSIGDQDLLAECLVEYTVALGFRNVEYYNADEDLSISVKRDTYGRFLERNAVPSLSEVIRENNPAFFSTPIIFTVKASKRREEP